MSSTDPSRPSTFDSTMYRPAHPSGSSKALRNRNSRFDEVLSGNHCMQGCYLLRDVCFRSRPSQELGTRGRGGARLAVLPLTGNGSAAGGVRICGHMPVGGTFTWVQIKQ